VFKPLVSGSRYGAVVLYNNASTPAVVATGYLAGIGGGPQVVLYPGTNNASLFTGFYNPDGLFVDPSGSVFIGDTVNQRLVKETYSTGTYSGSVIAGGLGFYAGPSVDGAGNIYGGVDAYSSPANQVDEFQLSGTSYVGSTIGSGWNGVRTTAVDSLGNVYVVNQNADNVIEEPYPYTSQTTVAGGLNQPSGVGVDLAGDVYIADSSNTRVIEETPAGGGSYTLSNTIGSGLSFPADVKTDGNGNVYIADYINYNSGRVLLETLSAGTYTQSVIASTASDAYSVAVDGKGNVYYAGVDNNIVGEVDVADPQTFTFPATVLNATSSPITATLVNIGNANLNISALTVVSSTTGDYAFGSNTCASGTPVAQGTTCAINVTFKPTVTGTITGTVTLTDNHLNGTSVTQTINLTGVGSYQLVYTTAPPATLQTAQNAGTVVVAIQNSASTVTSQTQVVTLVVTGPSYSQTYNVNAVAGVAMFNLSSAALAATGTYTYAVSATNCFSATASEIVYPYGLVFTTAPPASLQTAQNAGTVAVTIQNNGGGTATTQTAAITLTVTGPSSYSQAYTANAVNGVATFNLSSVALTTAGGYTYTATGPTAYYTAASASETVYPYVLAFTTAPATPIPASNNANPVTIAIQNNSGAATTQTSPVTLTVTGPNSYSQTYGPASASGTTGTVSFTAAALTLDGTYTYTATSSGLTTGTATQVITPATAVALKVTPASTTAYLTYADNMTVTALDTFGNVVTTNTDTIALTSTDSGAVLPANFALASGTSTQPVTFATLGSQTVTATDVTNNAITPATTSPSITVNAIPTFTVTVLTDTGGTTCTANAGANPGSPCELRAAMSAANGLAFTGTTGVQPIVNFAPALYSSPPATITLGSAIVMSANFGLVGPGPGNTVTLSGGGTTRILQQTTASTANTVSGLSLTAGYSATGGVWNSSVAATINFTNDIFTANVSPSANILGAAVNLTGNTTVTITGCTFSNNKAAGGASELGGALYMSLGAVSISNSTFNANTAQGTTSEGGAIYLSGVTWTISGSSFLNNTSGSGTSAYGGAIFLNNGTGTLSNSLFSGNTATSTAAISYGGALYTSGGTNNFYDTTFTGNTATSTIATGGTGGALYQVSSTNTFYNVTATANTSHYRGGGVYKASGSLYLYNSIVSGNTAPTADYSDIFSSVTAATGSLYGIAATGTTNPLLSALGNYGGPTQTMIPLPGSPALRLGNSSSTYTGGRTTDQRGYPRLVNGYVDAGAVQTNYSLSFVTQPSNTSINASLLPPPTVQIYESGVTFGGTGGTLKLAASEGTPSITSVATTSTGLESLAPIFTTPQSDDALTVSILGTGSAVVVSTSSEPFNITDSTNKSIGFTISPPITLETGGNAGTVKVGLYNSSGIVDSTSSSAVTLAVTGAATASYGPTAAVNGIATFNLTADALTTAGSYTYTASSNYTTDTVTAPETVGGASTWLLNSNGTLVKLNSSGGLVMSGVGTSGSTASYGGVAFDSTGDVWSVDSASNSLSYATNGGTAATRYSGGGLSAPVALAVDGAGYIWIANSGNNTVSEFTDGRVAQSPSSGYGAGTALNAPSAVAIDATGGVWVASKTGNTVTHIFGAATPVATPLSTATATGVLGAKP